MEEYGYACVLCRNFAFSRSGWTGDLTVIVVLVSLLSPFTVVCAVWQLLQSAQGTEAEIRYGKSTASVAPLNVDLRFAFYYPPVR